MSADEPTPRPIGKPFDSESGAAAVYARWAKSTPEERSEAGRRAARARYGEGYVPKRKRNERPTLPPDELAYWVTEYIAREPEKAATMSAPSIKRAATLLARAETAAALAGRTSAPERPTSPEGGDAFTIAREALAERDRGRDA